MLSGAKEYWPVPSETGSELHLAIQTPFPFVSLALSQSNPIQFQVTELWQQAQKAIRLRMRPVCHAYGPRKIYFPSGLTAHNSCLLWYVPSVLRNLKCAALDLPLSNYASQHGWLFKSFSYPFPIPPFRQRLSIYLALLHGAGSVSYCVSM